MVAVIFDEDLRLERALRIPREAVKLMCPRNEHANGRPIGVTPQLLEHPSVVEVPLDDGPLDDD